MYVLCYVVAIDDIAFLEYEATINEKRFPVALGIRPPFFTKSWLLCCSARENWVVCDN